MKRTWNRPISSGSTDRKINVFVSFAGTSVTKFNFFKFQSMSILVIHCNRRQETVSMARHSLKQKKKLDYYFRNSVAKTRCSFLQDSKLLVCTWRHDGHVGGPKHFSPLETKPYFHVNSRRKKNYFVLTTNMTALSRGCKPRISLTWLVNIYSRSLLQLKLYW